MSKPSSSTHPPKILLIAGSDPSGGAGLEADQRVLALHNCYALTLCTALTAQTTTGVADIHVIPTEFVIKSLRSLWDDVGGVDVVKIGMLSTSSTAHAIAHELASRRAAGFDFTIVLDPVMKSTSGAQLLPDEAVAVLRRELLPLADVVTPNVPEALLLVSDGHERGRDGLEGTAAAAATAAATAKGAVDREWMLELARRVSECSQHEGRQAASGPKWVLLKGGHAVSDLNSGPNSGPGSGSDPGITRDDDTRQSSTKVVDLLYARADEGAQRWFETRYVQTRNTHGTGCSLASAIAANVALGSDIPDAVAKGCAYVQAGIESAAGWKLGKGNGPIDHWAGIEQ